MDKLVHQPVVTRHNDDQILALILHGLQQCVDGLLAEVVFALLGGERVGLVDEQHAALGLLNDLAGLGRRLSDVAGHQPGAVNLHELPLGQHAKAAINARHHPCDHALARAGIARKDHVQRHIHGFQTVLPAQIVHRDHVDQAFHLALHAFKADQLVELGLQILDLFRRRQRLLVVLGRGGLLRRLVGGGRRVLRLFLLRLARRAPDVVRHASNIVVNQRTDHVQLRSNDLIPVVQGDSLLRNQVASSIPHLPCLVHPSHGFDGQVI